jgi:hypothetical protein
MLDIFIAQIIANNRGQTTIDSGEEREEELTFQRLAQNSIVGCPIIIQGDRV